MACLSISHCKTAKIGPIEYQRIPNIYGRCFSDGLAFIGLVRYKEKKDSYIQFAITHRGKKHLLPFFSKSGGL